MMRYKEAQFGQSLSRMKALISQKLREILVMTERNNKTKTIQKSDKKLKKHELIYEKFQNLPWWQKNETRVRKDK